MKKISVLSMAIAAATLAACGGDNSPNKPNLCGDVNVDRCDQVIIPISSSSSSSSSIAPPVNDLLPIVEKFEAQDAVELFSSAYKSLLSPSAEDPNPAFYYPASGLMESRLAVESGKLSIGNARFTIGQGYLTTGTHLDPSVETADFKVNTTTAGNDAQKPTSETWGELDLTHPWKMSFCVEDWEHTGSVANNQLFMVYVDNNQSSKDSSIHGQYSLLMQTNVDKFTKGKRVEISIPGEIKSGGVLIDEVLENPGTTTSFLQVRVPSSALITMSNLWIGYQNDTSTEPAADTCSVGSKVPGWGVPLPPTVATELTLVGNDGALLATWKAAPRATSYSLAVSEQNDVATAQVIADITSATHLVTGLTNGKTYYVWVKAKNASGESEWSEVQTGVPEAPATAPAPVSDLRAFSDDRRVAVSWNLDTSATEYKVYKNTVNSFESAELVTTTTTAFTRIKNLENDSPYYIFITGVNSAGEGEPSVVSATPSKGEFLYQADFSITKEQFFSTDNSEANATPSPYTVSADSEQSIQYVLGGEGNINFVEVDGVRGLQFFNARFAIGQLATANEEGGFVKAPDTNTTDAPQGVLNLTNNYQVCYTVIKKNAAGQFQIYLDNNTSSQGNSIHGNKSRLMQRDIADIPLNEEQCLDMVDDNHFGTETSFIQVRVPSNGSPDGVVLSSLRIKDLGTTPVKSEPNTSSSDGSSASSVPSSSSSSSEPSSSSSSESSVSSSEPSSASSNSDSSSTSSGGSSSSNSDGEGGGSSSAPNTGIALDWTTGVADTLSFIGETTVVATHTTTSNSVSVTATGGNLSSSNFDAYFVSKAVESGSFRFSAKLASVSGDSENIGNSNRFGILAIAGKTAAGTYDSIPAFADIGFYYGSSLSGSRANSKADGTRTRSDVAGIGIGSYIAIEIYDDGDKKRIRRMTSTDGITWTQANSTTDVKAKVGDNTWHLGIFAAPGTNNVTFQFTDIKVESL